MYLCYRLYMYPYAFFEASWLYCRSDSDDAKVAISSKITSLMEKKREKKTNACPVDNFVALNVKKKRSKIEHVKSFKPGQMTMCAMVRIEC